MPIEIQGQTEDILIPALPICDPHYHLWDKPNNRYLLEECLRDVDTGHRIVQTVFIECDSMYRKDGPPELRPVGETEAVQAIADLSASRQHGAIAIAAGIVGFADLTLGSRVASVLEAHIAASKNRFRGIRQTCAWDANPEITSRNKVKSLMLDPKFREGFACLHKYNLVFDSWQYHPQLMELVDPACAFPDTPIIVEHAGGILGVGPYAGKSQEIYQEWKLSLANLAACPNVSVKLGGLGIPRAGFGWSQRAKLPDSTELAQAMAPYYLWCIEKFGVDRCMFESNFPVDKVSHSYRVLWNSYKRLTKDFSRGERAALFHDTAARIFRLAKTP